MAKRTFGAVGAETDLNRCGAEAYCSMEALSSALEDWRRAQQIFDRTDDPVLTELAVIRLEAAHRRFGCLAAELVRMRVDDRGGDQC